MSRRHLGLVLLLGFASAWTVGPARAAELDVVPSRLSVGDCAGTLGGAAPLVLESAGVPALRADEHAFRQLATQLGGAIAPLAMAPVITSGPQGLDVGFETRITKLDAQADYWQRGTRGEDGLETCDGRNRDVRGLLTTHRLQLEKGLPFGFSVGAMFGKVQLATAYLVGADVKFSPLEEVWHSRVPDFALRAALASMVGSSPLALHVVSFDVLLSERFVVLHALELSPYAGAGAVWTQAATSTVDLTPNIDAVACQSGLDPVCNAGGLGASAADLAHEVRFERVSLLRYRAFAGLALRHRWLALTLAGATDLAAPRTGERGRGTSVARQWTFSVAPSVSF